MCTQRNDENTAIGNLSGRPMRLNKYPLTATYNMGALALSGEKTQAAAEKGSAEEGLCPTNITLDLYVVFGAENGAVSEKGMGTSVKEVNLSLYVNVLEDEQHKAVSENGAPFMFRASLAKEDCETGVINTEGLGKTARVLKETAKHDMDMEDCIIAKSGANVFIKCGRLIERYEDGRVYNTDLSGIILFGMDKNVKMSK